MSITQPEEESGLETKIETEAGTNMIEPVPEAITEIRPETAPDVSSELNPEVVSDAEVERVTVDAAAAVQFQTAALLDPIDSSSP